MRIGLGIDTGGTFTDAVIINLDTGDVLDFSKSPTTRDDLVLGIRGALGGLDKDLLKSVSLTSLSSTLATNSVVEGKGCRAGLVCIGKSYEEEPVPEQYVRVEGSFDMNGNEVKPLDTDSLRAALEQMRGLVDSLAVAGYLSVRNPAHEKLTAEIATEILNVPVVCTHVLTSKLGFAQRATTALMNARLIPVIQELISAVKSVMKELGIDSPLMIVKGDGSLMRDTEAVCRPVETILSGPASSLTGAKALTGLGNAVVIDMGGTTSDIGILRDGRPHVDAEGALIGGHRTRVRAADVSTFGIGGDSRIVVNGREVSLSPVRVIPLCFAATRWPTVRETIMSLASVTDDRAAEKRPLEKIVQDTEFFTLAHRNVDVELTSVEEKFIELLSDDPMRIRDAADMLDVHPNSINAARLESLGYVTRIGFTPTDVIHAQGTFTGFDAEVSSVAAGYLARKCHRNTSEFLTHVHDMIVERITRCTMEKVILEGTGRDEPDETERSVIDRVLSPIEKDYTLGFTLRHPIIGTGAPVSAWLPDVAARLNTELVIPENPERGNAIGAVTGSVSETVEITVRATCDTPVENPECNVFTGDSVKTFPNPTEALEYARSEASRKASEAAIRAGAAQPVVEVSEDVRNADFCCRGACFRSAVVTATATGKPAFE